MRRCRSAHGDDRGGGMHPARGMGADCRSPSAGDIHSGIQLSADLGGDFNFVYYILSERQLA